MCGRFALTLPVDAMIGLFEARDALGQDAALDRPRYNIRPTERVIAAALDDQGERALSAFRWGLLPHWAKSSRDGPPLINARSETVTQKPAFKAAFLSRRCLVPADGFFEWTMHPVEGEKAKPIKQPHWIRPAKEADRPLVFGGIWRIWSGPDGEEIPSLAILTTQADASMTALHHRLPLRIAPENFEIWLRGDAAEASALLHPPRPEFYAHHPVSQRINKGGRDAPDDAALIEPLDDTECEGRDGPLDDQQPSLF